MSLQFSRSLRSLRVDSFKAARIGMGLAILLMGALLAWFFLAKVTLYENSSTFELSEDGKFLAEFSSEGLRRIRQGQSVLMRFDLGPDRSALVLPGMVYDTRSETNRVELITMTNDVPSELQAGKINGRVEVEVEYLTPAQLVFRATGKYLNGNEIPVSPQNTQ